MSFVESPTMEYAVKNADSWIKQGLAGNPNTPHTILRVLAQDEDETVRMGD